MYFVQDNFGLCFVPVKVILFCGAYPLHFSSFDARANGFLNLSGFPVVSNPCSCHRL